MSTDENVMLELKHDCVHKNYLCNMQQILYSITPNMEYFLNLL